MSDARVEEVWASDAGFWRVYRDSRNEFGETLER